MDARIALTVNERQVSVTTDPKRPLLDVLREDLQLTGTKYGCGEGRCGACTVLLDGKNVNSCKVQAVAVDGKSITTIEGLAEGDKLHPVQEAFLAEGAMQCGYCTPGMILTVASFLQSTPNPTDAQILSAMEGRVCRCCGYARILKAVKRAARA